MPTITLQVEDPAAPHARELISQLDAYLIGMYPPESNHLLSVDALRQPNVVFLVARVDDRVAGCGAYVNHAGEYAEIKRMYVSPDFRGLKLGRRILDELETRIRAAGLTVARLETGIRQTEALGLYERAGYRRRDRFGDYTDDPLSVFMEKQLT